MANDVSRLRALLTQSLRAPEPQRSAAEKELQQLQRCAITAPFLAALLEMCVALPDADNTPRNLQQLATEDPDVRLFAVLWLKHYLKAQWKTRKATSSTTNLLSDQERDHVRHVLLFAALYEPQPTIALHLSLLVAALVRTEYPSHWTFKRLFPVMLLPLRRQNGPMNVSRESRGLAVCYCVVKELATRRLVQHRKHFAHLSVELLPLLLQYWMATATQLNESLVRSQHEAASLMGRQKAATIMAVLTAGAEQLSALVTTTKLVSTMLLNAFRDLIVLQHGELMRSALVEFHNQLERLVTFREACGALECEAGGAEMGSEAGGMMLTIDKCMYRIAATIVGVQNSYPIEFREYLSPFLGLFWKIVTAFASVPTIAVRSPRKLQIVALQFFANVLSCRLYKKETLTGSECTTRIVKVITSSGDVMMTDFMVMEAQAAVRAFFTQNEDRFASMMNLVVMRYMTLTTKDLDEWQSDPEAYCTFIESLTAKESVRACAENVFLTLVQNFSDQAVPCLTQMTSSASAYLVKLGQGEISTVRDDQRILDMDAVLLAIGLGCYDLHDCFEFEPWFITNLVPILVNPDGAVGSYQGQPVLRFRIVWLVSCWLAQLSANVRPPLYDALLNTPAFFQQTDADLALQLRIVQTLESMMGDWGFEHDAFSPFLPQALKCLFAIFSQADEPESKIKVLSCLEAIVQACGENIVSFCHQISAPLPALWANESDASNLVRQKILQLMTKLLIIVKEAHRNPLGKRVEYDSMETLLNMCVQVIWFATDVSNPDEVFLMESGLELWTEALEVSTVYIEQLHLLFGNALRLMERDYEHVVLVLTLVEQYLRLGKTQFWQTYHQSVCGLLQSLIGNVKTEASLQIAQVTEIVVATLPADQVEGIVPAMKLMVGACIAFQQGEPKHEPENVLAGYLSAVARLMVTDSNFMLKTVLVDDHEVVVLVDTMLRLFYTVGTSPLTLLRRKVWALALCSTVMLTGQSLLEKTGQVVEVCIEVIEEEQEELKQKQAAATADGDKEGPRSGVYRVFLAHHKSHHQQLSAEDIPVSALDLKDFVCQRLNDLAIKLGSSAFHDLLQTVDSSVLRKFQS
uniref:Importin N-terminal domain-containing protein n=1 Tax=Peronospora matthiolae TaxID=2874970 RepID=A0AAV1TXD4_9STRA